MGRVSRAGASLMAALLGSGILPVSRFRFLPHPGPGSDVLLLFLNPRLWMDGMLWNFAWLGTPCSPALENVPQAGQGRLWVRFPDRDYKNT